MPTGSSGAGPGAEAAPWVADAPASSALLQLVRVHAQLATRLLARIGLVPPQELVLLHLQENGPVAQRELVRYLGRDRSTVTATVQAMERAGLVAREPSATDRRALLVRATARGDALCARVREIWREVEEVTFGAWEPAARTELRAALGVGYTRLATELSGREPAAVDTAPDTAQDAAPGAG